MNSDGTSSASSSSVSMPLIWAPLPSDSSLVRSSEPGRTLPASQRAHRIQVVDRRRDRTAQPEGPMELGHREVLDDGQADLAGESVHVADARDPRGADGAPRS